MSDANNDRLSFLPDEILSIIISHLSITDAAKLSISSSNFGRVCSISPLLFRDSDIITDKNCEFISFERIGKILHLFSSIDTFTLSRYYCQSDMERWFKIISEKHIKRLFLVEKSSLQNFFCSQTLVELHLRNCNFFPPLNGSSYAFPNVKILSMEGVGIKSDRCVDWMLWNCPTIEFFKLIHCEMEGVTKRVGISSRSLKTFIFYHRIELLSCREPELVIEDVPNLEHLTLKGYFKRISGQNRKKISLPRLHALHMMFTNISDDCLASLISGSPVLETLKLGQDAGPKAIWIRPNTMRNFDIMLHTFSRIDTIVIDDDPPNHEELIVCKYGTSAAPVMVFHAPKFNLGIKCLQCKRGGYSIFSLFRI